MDLSILFLLGIAALFVFVPIAAALGLYDAVDHLTSPPQRAPEPKIALTPEEKAEIAASGLKMMRTAKMLRALKAD